MQFRAICKLEFQIKANELLQSLYSECAVTFRRKTQWQIEITSIQFTEFGNYLRNYSQSATGMVIKNSLEK